VGLGADNSVVVVSWWGWMGSGDFGGLLGWLVWVVCTVDGCVVRALDGQGFLCFFAFPEACCVCSSLMSRCLLLASPLPDAITAM